jgi:hypothetical protein
MNWAFVYPTILGNILEPQFLRMVETKRSLIFSLKKSKIASLVGRNKTIFLAGRLALIQSVITEIATHLMQCALLPPKICKGMDKINRNFLWGDTLEKKKST